MSGKEQEGTRGWTTGETYEGSLCLRPRAAITKRHKLVTENVRNSFSRGFGGQRSKGTVSADPCSLWRLRGRILPGPVQLLVVTSHPRLADV